MGTGSKNVILERRGNAFLQSAFGWCEPESTCISRVGFGGSRKCAFMVVVALLFCRLTPQFCVVISGMPLRRIPPVHVQLTAGMGVMEVVDERIVFFESEEFCGLG